MSSYRFDTLDSLIEKHIFENGRINKEDRETNQKLIEVEIMERAKRLIRLLKDTKNIEYDLKNRTVEEEVASIMQHVVMTKSAQ